MQQYFKKFLYYIFLIFPILMLAGCGGAGSSSNNTQQVNHLNNMNTGLTVTMLNPSNGALNTSEFPIIQLQFSESVNNVNINTVSLHLDSPTGYTVNTTPLIPGANNTYTFSPIGGALPQYRQVYVVLTNGITSVSNNEPLAETNFNFTTGKFTSPTVAMISPINGDNNISISSSVQLQFSIPVNNVNSSSVTLHENSETGPIVPSIITPRSNNIYTVTPISNLDQSKQYFITLNYKITSVYDGQQLQDTNFNFTTGTTLSPTVSIITPADYSTIESLIPEIKVQFSESVNNVSNNNLTLHESNASGPSISMTNITSESNNQYSFSPTQQLKPNTRYFVVVESGITSAGSNLPLVANNFTFNTDIQPTVTMVNPMNHSRIDTRTTVIKLKFSESVANVSESTVTLHEGNPTGPVIATSTITAESNNIYSFSPSSNLKVSTKYFVVLTNDITSIAGMQIEPINFDFSVSSEAAAPSFAYISDDHGVSVCYAEESTGILRNCTLTYESQDVLSVTIDPSHSNAFIVEKKNVVTRCQLDRESGAFTYCSSTTDPTFNNPYTISFNPGESFTYLPNFGNSTVSVCPIYDNSFPINCITTGTGFSAPHQVLIDSTDNSAYVTNTKDYSVTLCEITNSGGLTNCAKSGSGFTNPMGMAISNDNNYLYVTSESTVVSCQRNTDNGVLSSCKNAAIGFTELSGIAVNQNYTYISDFGNGAITLCRPGESGSLAKCHYTVRNFAHPSSISVIPAG